MTNDVCVKIHYPKPACIHSVFAPGIYGIREKMCSTDKNSAIFLTDSA